MRACSTLTGGRCITEGTARPAHEVRWRTGAIGCLLPLLVLATLLFGIAAFRPALVLDMGEARRGAWLDWTAAVTAGGVNLPVALLALYLAFEAFRFGWRWADQMAVRATDAGLVPHRSLLMRPIPWAEIEDVRFVQLGRAPTLLIMLRRGGSRTIRGVENEDEAAERFAAAARERLGGGH